MLLMIYLCNLWFTYDLLMIYLWNGQGGCAYHTYESYHLLSILMITYVYLFHLLYLCQLRSTYYTYCTYDLFLTPCVKKAVQCCVRLYKVRFFYLVYLFHLFHLSYLWYTARIDDEDPGFEHDKWMKKRKQSEEQEPLRADRWYYKNMDVERDNPEQSGYVK